MNFQQKKDEKRMEGQRMQLIERAVAEREVMKQAKMPGRNNRSAMSTCSTS
jgi:hypothetical protein